MDRRGILLASCLFWLGIYCQAENDLFIDRTTESVSLPDNGMLYYKVRIPDDVPPQKFFLILDVFDPKISESDPDIYISSLRAFPSSQQSEWKCTAYGGDVCVVPKEAVVPGKDFHIAVFCQTKCTYRLNALLKSEIQIQEGRVYKDFIKASESKLFRFQIESDKDIQSITMWLQVGTIEMNKIRMFVTQEKEGALPPSSDNTIMVVPSWNGWAAKISKNDINEFCVGCAYKILISSKVDTLISLNFRTNKHFSRLKAQEVELYDLVNTNEKNCYEYKVRSNTEDLDISLMPFGGDPDLFVYLGKFPETSTTPDFQSTGESQEILTISAQEREKKNLLTGSYFICVFGKIAGSYKLEIKMNPPSQSKRLSLGCGITRTMKVKKGKFRVFQYSIDHSEKTNITFTLNSLSGNADLYVKFCSTPGKVCSLTNSDLESPDIIKSTNQFSVDLVHTVYDPKMCREGNYCGYLIGVKGVKQSSFSLSMDCGTMNYNILMEGSPYFGLVNAQENSLFQFFVEDERTEVVKVVLTSISGDADLLVSMIDPLHIEKTIERQSNKQSHISDMVEFKKAKDGSLNTLYRVTVSGFTQSFFSLTFTRENSTHQNTAIQLSEGVSQYGNIDYSQGLLYKFFFDTDSKENIPIRIQLTPLSGHFKMYIGVDYIPTSTHYTWISPDFDSGIYIQSSDEGYKSSGVYNILVEKQAPEDSSPHFFTIHYITSKRSVNLLETVPYFGNASRGHDKYYIFYLHEPKTVALTVTPLSGDPDLFVSLNPENKMPSYHSNDFASLSLGEDTIEIEYKEVQRKNTNCHLDRSGSLNCPVYIAVTCGSSECEYTLVVKQGNRDTQTLFEGVPQSGVASGENPALYEILVSDSQNSSYYIYISLKKGNAIGYGLIMPSSTSSTIPSAEANDVKSYTRANTEIMIITPAKAQLKCDKFCKYIIAVYCDPSKYMPGEEMKCEFSITATRKIKRITIGNVIVDEVEKNQYKYFTFWSGCTDCTLTFSLTPISDGDPDLYIKKGRGELPDQSHYDFMSASYRGDFLEISPSDEFFTKDKKTIAGRYTIGVYGAENCTYTLLVTSKKLHETAVNRVRAGVPIRMQTEAGSIAFFSFNSYKKADISIEVTLHTGQINLRANAIDKITDRENNLPKTESGSSWTSSSQNTRNSLLINSTDPLFKSHGIFLIGVEAVETSAYSLVVNYLSEVDYAVLKNGESFKATLHPKQKRRFSYVASSNTDIIIRLFTFYGSVRGKIIQNKNEVDIPTNSRFVIKNTESIFQIGTYYIVVEANNEETEFSISVEQRLKMTPLDEGQSLRDTLVSGQYKYFLYQVPASIEKKQRYINIFASFHNSIQDGFILIKEITRDNMQLPNENDHNYIIRYDPDLKLLGGRISINYRQVQALGIGIMVNESTEQNLLFDIISWTTGLVQMTPEQQYFNSFKNVGEMHYYELMTKPRSKIFVEVVPCFGEVEFYLTDSLQKIGESTQEVSTSKTEGGRLFKMIFAHNNRYFITVKSRAHAKIPGKNATISYTVRSIVSKKGDLEDIENYLLDERGRIEHTLLLEELTLKWGGVRTRKFQNQRISNVTYKIFMKEEGHGSLHTSCEIKLSEATEIAKLKDINEFTYHISNIIIGKKYVFNILAYIPSYNQELAYTPVTISLEIPHSRRLLYVLVILVALTIILGIVLFIYYRKSRNVERQLEYEMSDSRNLARTSATRDSHEYSHLTGKVNDLLEF